MIVCTNPRTNLMDNQEPAPEFSAVMERLFRSVSLIGSTMKMAGGVSSSYPGNVRVFGWMPKGIVGCLVSVLPIGLLPAFEKKAVELRLEGSALRVETR
jgi:hypothetical protein